MKARPLVLRATAAALIIATFLLARRSFERCRGYIDALNRRDVALARTAPAPGPSHPAITRRVVLVVVDGLAAWAAAPLPELGRLRSIGAHAVAHSHRPSLSRPNYVSILSGVPPVASGVRTNAYYRRVDLDSLPRRAAAMGLPSAFVTDSASSVATLFRGDFAEVAYTTWDGGLHEATRLALARDYRLVVLLPSAVDDCAHSRRMASPACRATAIDVDRYLGEVAAQLDLERDTLIITADHGHVASGGHGGTEAAVLQVPLVMVGAGIVPGADLGEPGLIDVAPTIAALLGLPAPVHGLGAPLLAGLALPDRVRVAVADATERRVARNLAVVSAEQDAGARARAAARPAAWAGLALVAVAVGLVLTLAVRGRLLRIDRRVIVTGALIPVVTVLALFADHDCVGSLSCFASAGEWTDRLCLAVAAIVATAVAVTYRRRDVCAEQRLMIGNGAHAIALGLAATADAAITALFAHDPFVVLPSEAAMFLLVATPPTLVAIAIGLLVWRAFDLVAVLARARAVVPVAVAVLGACSAPRAAPAADEAPRVVVLVVVDQLGEAAFGRKVEVATGGFAELLRRGRRMIGRLPYATSATAPGHAALSTGAPPAVTGIIGNEWWDAAVGREIKAVDDPAGGTSAARLRVDGVADVLLRARPRSRAVGVALKDRSAILALGHGGEPVWYDETRPAMVGRGGAPAWLGALADPATIAERARTVWLPSVPTGWLATWSGGVDDADGELAVKGWTASFPHATATLAAPASGLPVTPAGNRLVIDGALAALASFDLHDGAADYLAVSLSAHDYIVHAFGPDSWEAWDAFVRLDRDLGELIAALDAAAGRDGWAMILTADHGGPSSPEHRRAAGLAGARLTFDDIDAVAEAAAATTAGPGPWIAATRPPYVYLDPRATSLAADTRQRTITAIAAALARTPGLDGAWPTAALAGDCDRRDGDERAFCLSIDRARSGEVLYSPADGTAVVKALSPDTVTHGSVHRDDREVPVLLIAPGVRGGARGADVSTLQVAPTLARLLRVPSPPAAAEPALPR